MGTASRLASYAEHEFYFQPARVETSFGYELHHDMSNSDRMCNFRDQSASLIAEDKKDELLQLLTSEHEIPLVDLDKHDSELSNFILGCCIHFDAINCTKALLQGETGLTLDFVKCGIFPLHFAAERLSPKMTKYFLEFGYRANDKAGSEADSLPIDFAVRSVRRRVFWEEGQSLYSLIVKLVGERMYKPIETMLLLIDHLSDAEASEVVCRYAIQGKTLELAALILGLSEKGLKVENLYMHSNVVPSGEMWTLRQYVVKQIVMLENELAKLLPVDRNKLADCRKMKTSMMSVLMLLETFLRIQDDVARLVTKLKPPGPIAGEIPDTISTLFETLDLKLTHRDAAYLEKPLYLRRTDVERLRMMRKQQQSDEIPSHVQHFFPSGLPPLDSFPTVADFGWDATDPKYDKLLTAVELLSSGINASYWTPNQSIFKLIVVLCLPEMKQKLGVIRLLAQNIEEMNEIAFCCVKESKLIQLAIILMVAWEKVRDPFLVQIKGDYPARFMTFQQFINSELAQVVDLEYRLIGRTTQQERELRKLCKERKVAMISALPLLEIFEKADSIRLYFLSERNNVRKEEVVKHVMKLLAQAGFVLKPKDIEIGDIVKSSKVAALEHLNEAMQEFKNAETMTKSGSQRQDTRLSYLLPCGFIMGDDAYGQANGIRNFLLRRYPRECRMLSPAAQSFRALWTSRSYSTSTSKALEVELHKDIRGVKGFVHKFPGSKQLASVALVVKRGIKYA